MLCVKCLTPVYRQNEVPIKLANDARCIDVLLMYWITQNQFHSFICSLIVPINGLSNFLRTFNIFTTLLVICWSGAMNHIKSSKCTDISLYIWIQCEQLIYFLQEITSMRWSRLHYLLQAKTFIDQASCLSTILDINVDMIHPLFRHTTHYTQDVCIRMHTNTLHETI